MVAASDSSAVWVGGIFGERQLPTYGPAYREYAYVTNGKSNTVSVIDLRTFQPARTIQVGSEPTGIAANPQEKRNLRGQYPVEQHQRD